MNKVIYVPSFFKPVGKEVTKKVPTGEKKKGFFGGEKDVTTKVKEWQQTGYSDRWIDGERLANDIAEAVSTLNNEGYEVVSITPITSGEYNYGYLEKPDNKPAYEVSWAQGSILNSISSRFWAHWTSSSGSRCP